MCRSVSAAIRDERATTSKPVQRQPGLPITFGRYAAMLSSFVRISVQLALGLEARFNRPTALTPLMVRLMQEENGFLRP